MDESAYWPQQVAWTVVVGAPTALIFAFQGWLRDTFLAVSLLLWVLAVLYILRGHVVIKNLWFQRQAVKIMQRRWAEAASWRLDVDDMSPTSENQFALRLGIPYAMMPGENVQHPSTDQLKASVGITDVKGKLLASCEGINFGGTIYAVYPKHFEGENLPRLSKGKYSYEWTNIIRDEPLGRSVFEIEADGHVRLPQRLIRQRKRLMRRQKIRVLRGLD